MTSIVQSYFDTLLRYAVTFCGVVVLKVTLWTKRHSLSSDEVISCVLCIYKQLESLPDTSSQIVNRSNVLLISEAYFPANKMN